jgi:hypothetical protein
MLSLANDPGMSFEDMLALRIALAGLFGQVDAQVLVCEFPMGSLVDSGLHHMFSRSMPAQTGEWAELPAEWKSASG